MRLHQSGGDFQIGIDKTAIKLDRGAARGVPKIHMCRIVTGKVVVNPDSFQHPRVTDQFLEFCAFVWTMQACGHQNIDVLGCHPGVKQLPDNFRQQQSVGYGPGDVANGL